VQFGEIVLDCMDDDMYVLALKHKNGEFDVCFASSDAARGLVVVSTEALRS